VPAHRRGIVQFRLPGFSLSERESFLSKRDVSLSNRHHPLRESGTPLLGKELKIIIREILNVAFRPRRKKLTHVYARNLIHCHEKMVPLKKRV